MKGPSFSLSALLALSGIAVVCAVIPAVAQVAPPSRDGGNDDNAPPYVDNANRQPYYVDGVEYRPYVPDRRKPKPADVSQVSVPASGVGESAQSSRANVPETSGSSAAIASADGGTLTVSASSSSSSTSPESLTPQKRPRYAVAVIEALDKVTAETIRFEAPIGKPVRYKGLIYTARACETTAADEMVPDVMAYLEVRTNPVAATSNAPAVRSREVFHGWSFASAPSLNPIEHPNYDAWVIGCLQPLPGV